jgi:transcriptional regulator with XRE-family HTH domain
MAMPRKRTPDPTIGERIRMRRLLGPLSIRQAADRAGISHTTWSRIEQGTVSADNRFTIAAIAEALRCSVMELTGVPAVPVDAVSAELHAGVHLTLTALMEADLDYPPTVAAPPMPELVADAALVRDLRVRCDYLGATRRLPGLLRGLHAATVDPATRRGALRLLVLATEDATFVTRFAGHPAVASPAAERCWQVAAETGDPVLVGLAGWARAGATAGFDLYERTVAIAARAAETLERDLALPAATEVLGQLHLTCALALRALGRTDDAAARVSAAEELAGRTGETRTLELMFGPTNIRFWRVAMECDGGEPGRAVEIANHTESQLLPMPGRLSCFYLDTGRALARMHGKDRSAVRALTTAERIAPQRIRNSPFAVEAARALLERARRNAAWPELRGFCERVGVPL